MMITGTVGQREVFLEQIKELSSIRELRVVRGEAVSNQFGPGNAADSTAQDDVITSYSIHYTKLYDSNTLAGQSPAATGSG